MRFIINKLYPGTGSRFRPYWGSIANSAAHGYVVCSVWRIGVCHHFVVSLRSSDLTITPDAIS